MSTGPMPIELTLRSMRPEDLELVGVWLARPHVSRWYLAGSTLERELEELRQSVAGEQPTHALVVLEGGRPIGWCQWYLCSDYPDYAAGVGAHPGDIGVDFAIGEPARTGQGVGTRLIAALIAHVRRERSATGLLADPEAANVASRRVLEKNGFRLVREGAVESERTAATMAVYRLDPPELADAGFATALVLGDLERVRSELDRDPELASRADSQSGWTPLHLVAASRWHWLQPPRTEGLVAVARLLLDAGADLHARSPETRGRSPLACAAATASQGEANERLISLLLERGATPDAEDLYLVGFARNADRALRLMLEHVGDVAAIAGKALAASISGGDTGGVRVLLDAGADPRRFRDDDGEPGSALHAAIESRCPAELVELLLVNGADLNAADQQGRSAYRAATAAGRSDIAELLRAHGARDDATPADRLLSACMHADEAGARRELAADPRLLDSPAEVLGAAALRAAEAGNADAVALLLELGFPIGARVGDHGGTLLHVAAYAGSADVAQLLVARGADLEGRDSNWEDTPLSWASVGSGERPATNPEPDWPKTVRILLDAGASTDEITFSPDAPKPPSGEVAAILRHRVTASQETPS